MAEYLPTHEAARSISCHCSPRLKMIYVLVYTHEVISNTLDPNINFCKRKPFRVDLIDISKCAFTPVILSRLDHASFTSWGVNNAQEQMSTKIKYSSARLEKLNSSYFCIYVGLSKSKNVMCFLSSNILISARKTTSSISRADINLARPN